MTCTAMASIVSALVAMYFVQTWITYVAFSIPLFTSSLLLIQQCRLRGVSPLWLLRQTIHKVQQEVHRLQNANQVFRQEVARLETQHRELQHMEQRLEQSVKRKGGDMREMKRLIHEYGTIQRKMKRLIAAEELQQLMSVMLNSDSNKDFIYSDKEIDQLIIRLQTFSLVDRDRLRSVFHMASTKSFSRLYQSATQEYATDYPEKESPTSTIFRIGDCHGGDSAFDYVPWD
ncbi:hypothetical protein ACA910_017356 [Epithemia clementina (nom. ined.)]